MWFATHWIFLINAEKHHFILTSRDNVNTGCMNDCFFWLHVSFPFFFFFLLLFFQIKMGADSHPSFHVTIFYLDKIPNALYQREREREREREEKRAMGVGGTVCSQQREEADVGV
jgi:hypothetical protein